MTHSIFNKTLQIIMKLPFTTDPIKNEIKPEQKSIFSKQSNRT